MKLEIHHIGCLVDDIEISKLNYKNVLNFTNQTATRFIPSLKISVSFIEIGKGVYIELIQPSADSPLLKHRQKSTNYYHIGYFVENIEEAVKDLCEKGAMVLTSFKSESFNNNQCVFLFTADKHLIELIEK